LQQEGNTTYILYAHQQKYPSNEKGGVGPQRSLKINSSGVKLLWPVGPKDKRNNFPNG